MNPPNTYTGFIASSLHRFIASSLHRFIASSLHRCNRASELSRPGRLKSGRPKPPLNLKPLGLAVALAATGAGCAVPPAPSTDERAGPPGTVFRDTLKDGGKGPQMVVLPTGTFWMGSQPNEPDLFIDEEPWHLVTISQRIAMGRYEVTVGEFRRFVTASGYRTEAEQNAGGKQGCRTLENTTRNTWDWTPGRSWSDLEYTLEEDQPVTCVSWNDARRYIEWLNEQTDGRYRLPSEAEWEYAVRAGSSSRYHFGDDESEFCRYENVADTTKLPNGDSWDDRDRANCSDGAVYPTAVGSYWPNAFGLYDLHGNVSEWVEDCYHGRYEGAPTDGSAWTSDCASTLSLTRGGSWIDAPRYLRAAYRIGLSTSYRAIYSGFRLAQDLNP